MAAQSNVTLPLQDLLQALSEAVNHSAPNIQTRTPFRTTLRDALEVVLASLGDRNEEFLVFPPPSGRQRRLLRQEARERKPPDSPKTYSMGLPIVSSVDLESLQRQPRRPLTEEARQLLRNMARQAAQENFHNPFLLLQAGLLDDHIPTILGSFSLQAIDADVDDPTCKIEAQMVFDTGAHYTTIAEELLPDDFREYLRDPIHDPYQFKEGVACQVEARIAFSNHPVINTAVVVIMPSSNIPNNLVGIIFGQNSCIDRLNVQLTPRSVITARGGQIGEQYWGEITASEYVDIDGQINLL